MTVKKMPLVAILATIFSIGISAQTTPSESPRAQERPATITISFFANDGHGNPVNGVTPGDLSIVDEHGSPLSAITLGQDTSPLRLGVVIDKSNSQRQSELYRAGLQVLSPFLNQVLLGNEDRVFIETFDTIPNAPTEWMNVGQLATLKVDLQPAGGSSLFDAIQVACRDRMSRNGYPVRRVLVLLTDGGDNQSQVSLDAAIASAEQAATVIFAVSTNEDTNAYQEHNTGGTLKRLAEKTGGSAFLHLGPKQMSRVFSEIKQQIDNMYQVTYIPPESAKKTGFHQIQIKPIAGKKLHVRAPERYYMP